MILHDLIPQVAEENIPQRMDAAGEDSLYDGFMVGILSDAGSFKILQP